MKLAVWPCVRDGVDDYTTAGAATRAGASRNPADMKTYHKAIELTCAIAVSACAHQAAKAADPSECSSTFVNMVPAECRVAVAPNTLTPAEQRAGWRLLFDGKSFDGWRGLGYDSVQIAKWKIENGTIRKLADGDVPRMPDGQPAAGGDLMTRETFTDFELAWDWKVSRAGNSGVKYNVSEKISMANAPNHAALGFEYQMLDDSLHEDNKVPSHRAGALYDLIAPNGTKALKPVGEWNSSRIVFRGNHGEHWLNGAKVVEYELRTPRMDSLLAASKYRSIKGFADRRAGHIVLQDHVDEVWFRNIRIRPL